MTEIVLLALLGPFALFPSPGRFVALLAIPAWWAWRWLRPAPGAPRRFVPRTPLDGAALLLALMVLVSAFATRDLPASLPKIAGVVYGLAVFYALVRACRGSRAVWAALGVFLALGAGLAVLAVFGTRWPVKFAFLDALLALLPARLTGLPGAELGFDPNEVGGTLVWIVPLALALAVVLSRRRAALRARLGAGRAALLLLGLWAEVGLLLGVLFLTQSRSALLGCAVALGGLALLAVRRRPVVAMGGLAAGAGAALLAIITVGPVRLLQMVIGLGGGGGQPASLYTVEGRIETWVRAVYALQDFPFTGMGMNLFRQMVHLLYPMYLVAPGEDIGHAHNLWLQAGVDLGVPGLVAYLALWLGAAVLLVQAWRAAERAAPGGLSLLALAQPVAAGLGGGLLAHFVFGLTDTVALGAKPGFLWWLLLGLSVALYQRVEAAAAPAAEG